MERVVLQCMDKDPKKRYWTATELALTCASSAQAPGPEALAPQRRRCDRR